ncbi:UNVERIFIED_CONTAM: polyprotein [Sesamum latifolium]|uniref:Polyprotein n=1 Tax=Sesamum latifolium TaxID=2727402 RepID=A0AAW2XRD6_9LAMI
MITPIPVPEEIITPIASFGADGHRIIQTGSTTLIWDVDPSMCDPECSCGEESDDDDDDYVWSDYESDEDDEFSSCNNSDDDYDEPDPDDHLSLRTPQPCMMFQYDTDFPPMERYVDSAQKYSSKPYVQNNVVDTEGKLKPLTQAEEVLNWQTTNARARTEPVHLCGEEDEDTNSTSSEDLILSQKETRILMLTCRHTSILMADAESSRRPQEQVLKMLRTQTQIRRLLNPREWLHTFSAWIDLQLTREGATLSKVLKEFASRFTGTLRDWFQSLGDYRQVQFSQATNPSIVLGAIHQEFIGDASLINKMASQEYFAMKCCSLKRKDLDFHFKRMSEKFYMLNGLNDPNLKHVFLASLPQELQPEIQRMIASTRRMLHSLASKALLKKACNKSHLEIQCKKKVCLAHQNTSYQERRQDEEEISEILQKKTLRKKKTDRCYLCGKKGHFARRCPNKKEKSAKMVAQILQISETTLDDTDIESLYSDR